MKCETCGAENPDNATFCSLCLKSFAPAAAYPAGQSYYRSYEPSPNQSMHVPPQTKVTASRATKRNQWGSGRILEIRGIEGMSQDQLRYELARGGRFIVFRYCISVIIITFRRISPAYFIKAGESHVGPSVRYSLISCFLGWWGIPWGLIFTPEAILKNLVGGVDVTGAVSKTLALQGVQGLQRGVPISKPKVQQSRPRRILKILLIALIGFIVLLLIIGLTQK